MEDSKITDDGNDDSHSEAPSITFKKYDGMTMKALPGAEFPVYDSKGKVYKTVTTGADGYACLSFTSPGKYSYKETKAPNGYKPDDTVYEFEIKLSMHMTVPVFSFPLPIHLIHLHIYIKTIKRNWREERIIWNMRRALNCQCKHLT